jgi:4,5-dihydroxyphthalate decarboxylase
MKNLQISLSCGNYDRTAALFDGRVGIEGCDVTAIPLEPEEVFHRAFKFGEFDVTEISMSSHMVTTANETSEYIAVPAFLSRVFRHSGIYVRTDRGIDTPQDLRGKLIGVPEYQITANVWIRGILQDDYGVKPSDIKWRRGGIEEPGRGERSPIELDASVDLQQIPDDKSLSGMLESGEIDGYIGARAPSCFARGAPNVARLFPNYIETEQDYFRRTRIFPIMHMVGIRRKLAEQHPWLPVSVYKAFLKAKLLAVSQLDEFAALSVTLPWLVHHFDATKALMGADYWPYGLEAVNRNVIETFARYHHEQGLSKRRVGVEELFAASALDLSKI